MAQESSEPQKSDEESDQAEDFAALIDFHPYRDRFEANHRIPAEPRSRESILAELGAMAEEEDRMGNAGRVSGSIYHGGHDHYRFLIEAYGLFAHANVLQRDMYPSATKLEGEIVAMTASLLHGEAVADTSPRRGGLRRRHVRRHREPDQPDARLPRARPDREGDHARPR